MRAASRRTTRRARLCDAVRACLVVLPFVACGTSTTAPPNIVVILADTLRADRLGAYDSSRGLTPFLDELAAHATVFAHAYSQCSWTEPSVASLFTSRFGSQHGIVAFGSRLDPAEVTIAEVLQARGYATGAFIANVGLHEASGFGQGFDAYRVYPPEVDAQGSMTAKPRGEALGRDALRWLDQLPREPKRPVFLYLHYMEPHLPYSPPPAMVERVAAGRARPDVAAVNSALFFARMTPPDAATLRDIETVYDAEVMSLDETLRQTFAALRARHFLDDAVVIVTADHGEEFEEHGHFGHSQSLYNELIHVPLIVALPGREAHLDVRDPVSLVDVAPTLADLAGAAPPPAFEGRTLRAELMPSASWWSRLAPRREPRAVLSELLLPPGTSRLTPHERAVIVGDRKLIVGVNGEQERYDLRRDPAETVPVAAGDGSLRAALHAFAERLGEARAQAAPTVPADLRDRLKALGYLN